MFGNFAIYGYLCQTMRLKLKYVIFTKGILNIDLGKHLDFFLIIFKPTLYRRWANIANACFKANLKLHIMQNIYVRIIQQLKSRKSYRYIPTN